jgi:predicted DNA-binding transcriptional regulator YafY
MTDEPSLTRQLILIRTLTARRYGASVRELAHEMGVTEKTIRRDLRRFKRIGLAVLETTEDHGRKTWRLVNDGKLPPLAFTYDEAAVLYLARALLEPLAGTLFWEAANSAMRKIRATLNESAIEYLDHFQKLFHSTTNGFGNYASKTGIIDELSLAIEDRKAVHITYQSQQATEPATRDVYPYGFARHKGSLYLVAFAVEREKIRNYKVNRIEAAIATQFVFQRPADFDLPAYFAKSFGVYDGDDDVTVVVKFLPAAVRYVQESNWHSSQVLTKQRDGSVLARFQLSSTVEIKSWVFSFGASAVVIEPETLRADIARELQQLINVYSAPGPNREKEAFANNPVVSDQK